MLRQLIRNMSINVNNHNFNLPELLRSVERLDKHVYRSLNLIEGVVASQRIFGGQMMGQAIHVACNDASFPAVPRSLHATFLKGGNVKHPLLFTVEDEFCGKTRSSHKVSLMQKENTIISVTAGLQKHDEEKPFFHEDSIPNCPTPEELPKNDYWFHTYLKMRDAEELDYMIVDLLTKGISDTFDHREVDQVYREDLHRPRNVFWVKTHESMNQFEPHMHHATAAYISDALMIAAALRPHVHLFSKVTQIASLNHCIWFHRKTFDMGCWMLYETWSTIASGSRAFITGRMWTRDGKMVMTATQEALIRIIPR